MNATSVRSVRCSCRALTGEPCTPEGDHLARYLRAEITGVISRDDVKTVIAKLDILAPHVVVPLAETTTRPTPRRCRPTGSDPELHGASEGTRSA